MVCCQTRNTKQFTFSPQLSLFCGFIERLFTANGIWEKLVTRQDERKNGGGLLLRESKAKDKSACIRRRLKGSDRGWKSREGTSWEWSGRGGNCAGVPSSFPLPVSSTLFLSDRSSPHPGLEILLTGLRQMTTGVLSWSCCFSRYPQSPEDLEQTTIVPVREMLSQDETSSFESCRVNVWRETCPLQ